jgi:ABC-2 type transport system ATP-binding protein
MIETFNLTKIYPQTNRGIKNINLKIEKGEIFGLCGVNGSGKTTLIKVLCGILIPTSGKINLNNCSSVGVLLDYDAHYENLTGWENVIFFSKFYRVNESVLTRLFKLFDIYSYRNEKVITYSSGMKRKLSIIEVIAPEPDLVLLDDPLQNLDTKSKKTLFSLIRILSRKNKTILLTTTDVEEAKKICNRIGILKDGKLVYLSD